MEKGWLTLWESCLGILREDLSSGDAWVGRSWWLGFTLLLLCKEQTEPFISVSCSQLRSLPFSCCSLSGEMRGGKDAAKLHFAPVLGTSFAVSAVF